MTEFKRKDFEPNEESQKQAHSMITEELKEFPISAISVLEKQFENEKMRLIVISSFKKKLQERTGNSERIVEN